MIRIADARRAFARPLNAAAMGVGGRRYEKSTTGRERRPSWRPPRSDACRKARSWPVRRTRRYGCARMRHVTQAWSAFWAGGVAVHLEKLELSLGGCQWLPSNLDVF